MFAKTVKSGFSTVGHSLWDTFGNIWRHFLLSHIPIRWCVRGKSVESTSSFQFSCSVVSYSLRPHELQHARPPCPLPSPGVHSDSRPSSQWCHPAISSSVVPFSSCPQSLPAWVFSSDSTLCMRWPKSWSFSFSIIPSKEIPGLIAFRMDWLDILSPRDSQESSPTPQFKSINSSALSLLHSPTLTSIHYPRKNHSLREPTKYPIVYRIVPDNKVFSGPK